MNLYPVIFDPILKKIIWGGEDICKFKQLPYDEKGIGESWEISAVKNNVSVVANGSLKGMPLTELIDKYKSDLLGKHVYEKFGDTFPLLIKFIDAKQDLSIQVHPNDALAKKRHDSFGKTEMWYVIKAEPNSFLYCGFEKQMTPDEYVKSVADNSFMDYLKKYEVKEGDVFFLPAGRVHAIGAGCFIAEIQQTSDITYRIYDYNRVGVDGKPRELHTELAKDAIDFSVLDDYKTSYQPQKDKLIELAECQYFETSLLDLDKPFDRNVEDIDSFMVFICMEGAGELIDEQGNKLRIHQGVSVLVPATTKVVSFIPDLGNNLKILETFVP